ncbi:MAG: PEGA domain-containing protein [Vicinamibacterales bacterium]
MRITRTFITATALAALLAVPALADAQSRGRAVPRGSVRPARPSVAAPSVRPRPVYRPYYRPYYYTPYRPGVSLGFYYGYPGYIGPYAYGYGFPYDYGYRYRYGYPPYAYYGGVYPGYRAYGGVRIDVPQRDAEVYVDGYYAGVVNDFDGALQQVNLEPGPHAIEVRLDGYEPVTFDVNVEPGRTITYRSTLREARP